MRDPFDGQPHLVHSSRQSSGEFVPQATGALPLSTGYMLGNGDVGFWTPNSDSLIRLVDSQLGCLLIIITKILCLFV